MTKVPPAGRAAAGKTSWPLQSTAPPIVAAAPLKMGAKKGSAVIACVQVVMKSGARKWRSWRWGCGGAVTSPVSSCTRAPPRGTKEATGPVSPGPEQLPAAPATTASGGAAEGETAAIAVPGGALSAGKELGVARRGNPQRLSGSAGFSRPSGCKCSTRQSGTPQSHQASAP
jgi:hypothetical protein